MQAGRRFFASAVAEACLAALDTDILEWFRQQVHETGGGNYQTLINAALRETMQARDETLENVLRKVIREELSQYRAKS